MKIINKYFFSIMLFFVIMTAYTYSYKIITFINNSVEHTLVIDNINEDQKKEIINNLKKLTFQNVNFDEKENKLYIKIRCPADKINYFNNWILEKRKLNEL